MTKYFVRIGKGRYVKKRNQYTLFTLFRAMHFLSFEELHCNDVRISRKGILVIKPTQDTFVLAWRKKRIVFTMRLLNFVKTVSGFCFYKYKTKTRIVRCL